jgi:hypothetical protein
VPPTTHPDCPPEIVQFVGAIEHDANSREPSYLRLYGTVLNPARHTIEHNLNLNRAQESRTESDAKSMATQVAPLETSEKTPKPGRRSSKTKEQEPEQVISPEPAAASNI